MKNFKLFLITTMLTVHLTATFSVAGNIISNENDVSPLSNDKCVDCASPESIKTLDVYGDYWTKEKLVNLMKESKKYKNIGKKIDFISNKFIGTKYKENTLIGSNSTEEVLTINLSGVDCFTYLDYVQSLSTSTSFREFKDNIIKIRYKNGLISYKSRNHFFSDWTVNNVDYIYDITKEVAKNSYKKETKTLNRKSKSEVYLKGITPVTREIYFIPSKKIDKKILNELNTGDYVGIYSEKEGLDVSHTGIIIKKENEVFIRHSSSRKINKKVVDEIFTEYIKNKPGVTIYRPKEQN